MIFLHLFIFFQVIGYLKFMFSTGLLLGIGSWLLGIGFWLLAVGFWLLTFSFWLLAFLPIAYSG